jgi:histidine triad (HIT) family protein
MSETIFTKIINKEIPAKFEYEDDKCIVIYDKFPKSNVHLLVIPKKPIATIADAQDEDQELLGHLILIARNIGKKLGLTGYKLVFNVGRDGGQEVMHIHLHILG